MSPRVTLWIECPKLSPPRIIKPIINIKIKKINKKMKATKTEPATKVRTNKPRKLG